MTMQDEKYDAWRTGGPDNEEPVECPCCGREIDFEDGCPDCNENCIDCGCKLEDGKEHKCFYDEETK